MIGEQFFEIRADKAEDLDFDNVPFVLNCVDVLAGDESFVSLRKKRPKHRTLKTLEAQTSKFYEELENETKMAEDEARKELDAPRRRSTSRSRRSRTTPTGTSGPRKSSSPTSRASPSAGST